MIVFYISALVILVGICLVSKLMKPVLPLTYASYSKPFLAAAVLICKGTEQIGALFPRRGGITRQKVKNRKLLSNLRTLYPGESESLHYYRYRVEKISTILMVSTIGCIIGLLVSLTVIGQGVLEDGDVIYRGDYGSAEVVANLSAGVSGQEELGNQEITVTVPARVYSSEQLDEMFEHMSEEIDSLLLAENDSPDHIVRSLNLVRRVEGYPFSISWECSNYEFVDMDGVVNNEDLVEPEMVTLTADCIYNKEHRYLIRTLQICPQELTLADTISKELQEAVANSNEISRSDDKLILPESISFGNITWNENLTDNSFLLILITFLVCVLIGPIKENEISKKIKQRSSELLNSYPAFVSKLSLYMGAGMSVRNCFIKLGRDSEKAKDVKTTALGRELIISAHEIQVGIPEIEVYEHLGKRCGTREYMRFIALLNQNLRKGSTDLIGLLKEESKDAFEIRKNEARKLGEEASTKLLLPMIMMLSVVMIIIMVPAYMSFSS